MKLLKDKAFLWALYGGDDKTAMTVEIHWIYVRTGVWFPSAPLSKNPTVIVLKPIVVGFFTSMIFVAVFSVLRSRKDTD